MPPAPGPSEPNTAKPSPKPTGNRRRGKAGRGDRGDRVKKAGKGLWIMLGVLAMAGIWHLAVVSGQELMNPDQLWNRLGKPLLRTVVFVSAGLLVGQLIEALGWTAKLGSLVWPLIRRANLPKEAGAAFSAAFASGVAANTLLFTAWKEGKLTSRQLVLANVLNASLPAYFLHFPTTFFVVYGLLSQAALVYFGLTLAAAVLRSLGVIMISRVILPPAGAMPEQVEAKTTAWKEVAGQTWGKFTTRIKRMLIIIVPVYLVVFLLAQGGFFTWLGQSLAGWVSNEIVPVEAMSVIIFAVAAEFTSGFAAASALLESGSLVMKEIVIALLIGNVAATPLRALRHQLPHYMGIYSPALGARLLSIGQGARVISVLIMTGLYVWLG